MKFVDASVSKKNIDQAIKYCNFKNMHKMEKSGSTKRLPGGRALYIKSPSNKKGYKTRRGIVGGYKDYMNKKDIEYCNAAMRSMRSELVERYIDG